MSDSSVMAEKKLMILYLIYQMEIPMLLSEIQKFAKDTLCYELRPEHITGKIVNES